MAESQKKQKTSQQEFKVRSKTTPGLFESKTMGAMRAQGAVATLQAMCR